MTDAARTTHYRTCNLCEAMCGLALEVEGAPSSGGARVVTVRGDADDPLSRGFLCPKGVALPDVHEDPDRLRSPMRRTAAGWEEIGWEEALDEAAAGLADIQRKHGNDAVAAYAGNPSVHDHGAMLYLPTFLRSLKSRNRYSASSVDQLPHMVASALMLGHGLLIPVPDVDRTAYFLMLGANPIASGGSLMTAPGMPGRLEAIRKRGGRVVVIDPRRTETARVADEHHFIRPGTDALFLASFLHELLRAGAKLGSLEGRADGLEKLPDAVRDFPPERTAPHTGIPADVTRRLVAELRAASSAVCYGRVGTSTQAFGGLCQWLILAINAVSGNLDREGGFMFPLPAVDVVTAPGGLAPRMAGFGKRKSRVRGLPSFGSELPVAALAEEIETEGPGQIRALVTFAGNPVLSTPNGGRLERALEKLDFMVSIDPRLNETTRHARLILPGVGPLSRTHYDVVFHNFAVRNTARWSAALFPKAAGGREDWEILLELTERLEGKRDGRRLARTLTFAALRRLGPDGLLDLGLRFGPYGSRTNVFGKGLTLSKVKKSPHGVDLGPLTPCLSRRMKPGRRVDLAPDAFLADLPRLRNAFFEAGAGTGRNGDLMLIGRRGIRDCNSWMHTPPRLMRGKPRCTLQIHPDDARQRSLSDGELVEVASRVGKVRVPAELTADVMPGVVCLPHGYGHTREGTRLSVPAGHEGASHNDLTDELLLDELTGNAAFSGVPVRVGKAV